jgi:hypothetical protein
MIMVLHSRRTLSFGIFCETTRARKLLESSHRKGGRTEDFEPSKDDSDFEGQRCILRQV